MPKDQIELLKFDFGKIVPQNNFVLESKIIYKAEIWQNLLEMIGPKIAAELLYRGSRDGFRIGDCHPLILHKGPTLSVVKTTENRIFGGYTNIPWENSGQWKIDKGLSFVFSLKND